MICQLSVGQFLEKKMSSSQDSEIVNLLKNAGAIIMGKTVTCELAYIHPSKTKNPHDYSRTPGGSSSGSAAVIASHMAHLINWISNRRVSYKTSFLLWSCWLQTFIWLNLKKWSFKNLRKT